MIISDHEKYAKNHSPAKQLRWWHPHPCCLPKPTKITVPENYIIEAWLSWMGRSKKCDMYTWCEWTWPDSMSSLSKNPFRNWIFWDFALAVRLVDPNAWTRQVRIIGASFFAQSWVQLVNRGLCTRLAIIVHQLVHTQNIPKHIKGFNGCYQSSRSEG